MCCVAYVFTSILPHWICLITFLFPHSSCILDAQQLGSLEGRYFVLCGQMSESGVHARPSSHFHLACTLQTCHPYFQCMFRVGAENFCSVHVSLIPVIGVVGEQKTKPTQHSVQVGSEAWRGTGRGWITGGGNAGG